MHSLTPIPSYFYRTHNANSSELLDFFNTTLNMNLTKIEQTATGAVACQLADIMFPKSVPMSRVSWEAKTPPEYVSNYKLLQAAFTKNKVQRYVDVDKLIRAKYQDNLEFCQWLKAFYDQVAPPMREGYDPVAVRARGKGGKKMPPQFQPRGGAGAAARKTRPTAGTTRTTTTRAAPRSAAPAATNAAGIRSPPARKAGTQKENTRTGPSNRTAGAKEKKSTDNADKIVADATLLKKNKELTARNAELETTMLQMENERDFYFEKLRGIEVMLQVYEDRTEEEREATGGSDGVISKIFKVLYAGAEDGIAVNDEGELIGADGEIIGADADVDAAGKDFAGADVGEDYEEEDANVYNDEEFEEDEALNAELEASLLED